MPTQFTILPAIFLKFKYLNSRFFTTFTKNPNTTSAHQKEYTNLYNNALAIYKQTNHITIIDAATCKTINTMLKQMLISQYLTNTNFTNYTSFMIYKTIYYARGFLQIQNENEQIPKLIRTSINNVLQEKLIPLLLNPNEIPQYI